jgi:hypothetical protein
MSYLFFDIFFMFFLNKIDYRINFVKTVAVEIKILVLFISC